MSAQPWAGVDIRGKQLLFPEVDTDPFVGEHDWDKLTSTAFKAADINKENRKAAFAAYNAVMEDALKLEIPDFLTIGVGDKMEQVANPLKQHYLRAQFSLMDECAGLGTGASTGDAMASIQPCIARMRKIQALAGGVAKSQSATEKAINETYGADSPASVYLRRANLAYTQGTDPFAYTAAGKPMATPDLPAEAKKAVDMTPTYLKELMGPEQAAAVGGDTYRWLESGVFSGKDPKALENVAIRYAENSPTVLNGIKQIASDKAFNARLAIKAGSQVPQTTLVEYNALLKKMDDLTAQGAARYDMTEERRKEFDKQYAELSAQLRQVQNGVLWDPEKGYLEDATEAMYADAQMEKWYGLVVSGAYEKSKTTRFGGQHDSTLEGKLLNMAYRRQKMAEDKKKNAGGIVENPVVDFKTPGSAYGESDDALKGFDMYSLAGGGGYFDTKSTRDATNERIAQAVINQGSPEALALVEGLSGFLTRYGKQFFAGVNEDERKVLAENGIVQNESGQWALAGEEEGTGLAKRAKGAQLAMLLGLAVRRQDEWTTGQASTAETAAGRLNDLGITGPLADLLAHNASGRAWSDGSRSGAEPDWVESGSYKAGDPTGKSKEMLDAEQYVSNILDPSLKAALPKIQKMGDGGWLYHTSQSSERSNVAAWMKTVAPHLLKDAEKMGQKRVYDAPIVSSADLSLNLAYTEPGKDMKVRRDAEPLVKYGDRTYATHIMSLLTGYNKSEGKPELDNLRAFALSSEAGIPVETAKLLRDAADSRFSGPRAAPLTGDPNHQISVERLPNGGVRLGLTRWDETGNRYVSTGHAVSLAEPTALKTVTAAITLMRARNSPDRTPAATTKTDPAPDAEGRRTYSPSEVTDKTSVNAVRTVDGDTFVIEDGSGTAYRLDGIDAFEKAQVNPSTGRPIGYEAAAETRRLLSQGYTVVPKGKDDYGRTIAQVYVKVGDTWADLAETLLKAGHGIRLTKGYKGLTPAPNINTSAASSRIGR